MSTGQDTISLTSTDQNNQSREEEIISSTSINQNNQFQEIETISSTGVDRNNPYQDKQIIQTSKISKFFKTSKGKEKERFHINKVIFLN
jgi:hypothetical protein